MPRMGLSKPEAAKYVGVGVTKFEDLVASKRMPSPRLADTKLIWDVRELDDFFDRLPVKGGNQRNVWK